jgi:CheY-like chemotaxis protein
VPKTVLIADDNERIRKLLCRIFESEPDYVLCAEAVSGEEAILVARQHKPALIRNYDDILREATNLKPDIVLADLRMPGAHVDEAGLAKLVAACECPVIGMSFTADAETRFLAAKVGAARLAEKPAQRKSDSHN